MLIVRALRAVVWAGWLGGATAASAQASDVEHGRRLFQGEVALLGQVSGHTTALPPAASRCVNCHAAGTAPPAATSAAPSTTSASVSTTSFGPVLNAELLRQERRRRGGPASRYDEATFCKLLATGIDPAYIILPSNMPRYQLSTGDCKALWTYVTQR